MTRGGSIEGKGAFGVPEHLRQVVYARSGARDRVVRGVRDRMDEAMSRRGTYRRGETGERVVRSDGRRMRVHRWTVTLVVLANLAWVPAGDTLCCAWGQDAAEELTVERVLASIEAAKRFLVRSQDADGSWSSDSGGYEVGVTALATLALLNADMDADEGPVKRALQWLRSRPPMALNRTYEVALACMALVAARQWDRDRTRITALASWLEQAQIKSGPNAGAWSYGIMGGGGDRSNTQYAVLGLREAALAGAPISQATWALARRHWLLYQNPSGGWGYTGLGNPTGSMTVAGIASFVITGSLLRDPQEVTKAGTLKCCGLTDPDAGRLEKAIAWMGSHFAVGHNPGAGNWLLYYLYGMERAGRLSGRRFFGKHDWYREGAAFLIRGQSKRDGSWAGPGIESNKVLATSFALLFLSKGLAPVLMNKLQYPARGDGAPTGGIRRAGAVVPERPSWNLHPYDAHNLTELISTLPRWPRLVTWQVVDVRRLEGDRGVEALLQAPVLYVSGDEAPQLTAQQVHLLRRYLDNGGFIFAVNNCQSGAFEEGMRQLVARMYPEGVATLKPLPPEHPIYRSEYLLDPEGVELLGVDFGCRTPFVYCPEDLSCLWEKWLRYDPPDATVPKGRQAARLVAIKTAIGRANRIGVNVLAYATGRQPPKKLEKREVLPEDGTPDKVQRGLLQIAKLRHDGGWNTAVSAAKNLVVALNRVAGVTASPQIRDLTPADPDLFKYPLAYMHGRSKFRFTPAEREQLRKYLEYGNVLFADACCSSKEFDAAFRQLIKELFPEASLERIPPDDELFTVRIGYDLQQVRRRVRAAGGLETVVGEPVLEGVRLDGRWAVIYSKYDISCALEQQASQVCPGYVHEDAVKIAVNVVLYSILQDVRPRSKD
ncbi:MAG: DUF4159 domain-containing protein [Planctomycetota bacterium]|nr:MAG: DUF4159 domain-containing protein [Planctomycetota bacterium]